MPIKIKGSTSGSTTITAPATGSDETIELSTALASKLPYSYGTATPTTTDSGFLWYDSNSTPPAPKFWDGAAFQALTSGKILQVVRATDSTLRSTTSTSYVDVTGMSVTITPQKSDSAILVIASFVAIVDSVSSDSRGVFALTDSSDNQLTHGSDLFYGEATSQTTSRFSPLQAFGWNTPATTSATSYKLRFRTLSASTTVSCRNQGTTGLMLALEISA